MSHTSIHAHSTSTELKEDNQKKIKMRTKKGGGAVESMRTRRKRVQTCSQTLVLPKESELGHSFVGVVLYSNVPISPLTHTYSQMLKEASSYQRRDSWDRKANISFPREQGCPLISHSLLNPVLR